VIYSRLQNGDDIFSVTTKKLGVRVETVIQRTASCVSVSPSSENSLIHVIPVYQYGDAKVLMEQIAKDKDDGTTPLTEDDKTRLIEEVKKVMEYCTNISRCRRVQVLRYFNEVFDERDCHKGCDVCMDDGKVTTQDVTTEAIDAINLVKSMSGNNSMAHCKAVFNGSKKKDVIQRGHDGLPGHGKGTGLGQKAVDQLFEELIAVDAFREQAIANTAGWSNNYLQVSKGLLEY
jgi:superfamily II DNA helicase RecQ